MKRKILFFSSLVFAGIVIGLAIGAKFEMFALAESQPAKPVSDNMEDAVINVANTSGKAVVSIGTEHTTKVKGLGNRRIYFNGRRYDGESPFGGDENDPFRRFFDDFMGNAPEREFKRMGLGSGVIIDTKGHILTNEHVVKDADKIKVTLYDGREFKAEVKGRDPRSDLAVIKINANNLPVASLGDSDNLKIGQWVVAIGNPFGYALQNPEPTVTVGVISALHRSLGRVMSRDRDYNNLIQTDAAINPGNSGGPLVNLKGEIVGINVAIFSTSGGYQGVGFAIPVNSAKRIISRLIEGKKVSYGWLGITVQDLNDDLSKYFGLSDKNGVLVAKVLDDGPAAKAGMKESDVIKQFDSKLITNVKDLLSVVGSTEVGRKIKVTVIRDRKPVILDVQVGERPEDTDEIISNEEGGEEDKQAAVWRGISVEGLGDKKIKRFKTEEEYGVVVVDVEPGSSADEAGVIPGDVITSINKQTVKNISDYQKLTKTLKGDCLVRTTRGYYLVKEKSDK